MPATAESIRTLTPASPALTGRCQTVVLMVPLVNVSSCIHPDSPLGPVQVAVLLCVQNASRVSPFCTPAGTVACLNFVAPEAEWLDPTKLRPFDTGDTVTSCDTVPVAPSLSVTVSVTVNSVRTVTL